MFVVSNRRFKYEFKSDGRSSKNIGGKKKMLLNKLDKCLFNFQKRKINNELEKIENEMFNQYEKIGEKVDMINKLKSANY